VPEGAGVGVEIDPDQLARAAEAYRKCGMKERDDVKTMRLVDPDYKPDVLF
jgi:glucarate dehydratase